MSSECSWRSTGKIRKHKQRGQQEEYAENTSCDPAASERQNEAEIGGRREHKRGDKNKPIGIERLSGDRDGLEAQAKNQQRHADREQPASPR